MKCVLLLWLCALVAVSFGYKTGAPASQCESMTPGHKDSKPQTSPNPYTVTVTKNKITPGEKISLRIRGLNDEKEILRGFLIQGRHNNIPVGKFTSSLSLKLLDCAGGKQNAATHSSVANRTGVSMFWTAPTDVTTPMVVNFVATVVKDYKTYWVKTPMANVTVTPGKA
ncbi:unnamed protein product [Bemisia tabaci]|uniref:Reelin domain-containing protein n=1 Tax=Bemisia tabaci TaxID=7038 RepID=A0A9P0F3V6_BEMTA|nr:unnamed protein product [Bemisia tabaci]